MQKYMKRMSSHIDGYLNKYFNIRIYQRASILTWPTEKKARLTQRQAISTLQLQHWAH